MKSLIVYYSRTKHNQEIAKNLQKEIKADIVEIKDTKKRTNAFFAALAAFFRSPTKIKPIKKNISKYKHVVVCTPIWSGTLPPATRAFLQEYSEQVEHYHLISISGSGNQNKDFVKQFERIARQKVFSHQLIKEKEVDKINIKNVAKKIKKH